MYFVPRKGVPQSLAYTPRWSESQQALRLSDVCFRVPNVTGAKAFISRGRKSKPGVTLGHQVA